ncbi:MAG: hypothetical protein ACK46Y_06055 [Fluviicola sp.]|jgi:hypothetical protein
MKKFFFLSVLLLVVIASCKTKTTPRKVERYLPGEFWKVTNFTDNGVNLTANYSDYLIGFSESGSASVKISGQFDPVNGAWSVGTGKNPAILYLNFPLTTPIDTNIMLITDDWQVNSITDKEIKLSRNSTSQSASNVVLTR